MKNPMCIQEYKNSRCKDKVEEVSITLLCLVMQVVLHTDLELMIKVLQLKPRNFNKEETDNLK